VAVFNSRRSFACGKFKGPLFQFSKTDLKVCSVEGLSALRAKRTGVFVLQLGKHCVVYDAESKTVRDPGRGTKALSPAHAGLHWGSKAVASSLTFARVLSVRVGPAMVPWSRSLQFEL
jgi:hypothetical protein